MALGRLFLSVNM